MYVRDRQTDQEDVSTMLVTSHDMIEEGGEETMMGKTIP